MFIRFDEAVRRVGFPKAILAWITVNTFGFLSGPSRYVAERREAREYARSLRDQAFYELGQYDARRESDRL
jgi:hypothetical protein